MLKRDLTNKKFGRLTALFVHSKSRNGHIRWHCVCDCGAEKNVLSTHLLSKKTISCGQHVARNKDRKDWKGFEEISGILWNQIKRGADGSKGRRKIAFSITIKDVWTQFIKQNRKCALTGIKLFFPEKWDTTGTASLDRIDSSKGYTKNNIQWVHKDINRMKNSFNQDYFIEMCKNVAYNT